MSITGGSWYDDNGTRNYPLGDGPVLDDEDRMLPSGLLADLMLVVPDSVGVVGLLGITVGPSLITAVFGTSTTAVAAVSASRRSAGNRPIAIDPLIDHVGGWVVFGQAVRDVEEQTYKFSTPAVLCGRSVRVHPIPPVTSVGKLQSSTLLRGIVRLSGGNDVEIVGAQRQINGELKTVAVIRLSTDRAVQAGRNLYETYSGPCNSRPESGTCTRPALESVGGAIPDCNGNIDILFGSPFVTDVAPGGNGITVDFPFGLSDVCDKKPFETDDVPGERSDSCQPTEEEGSYTREFSYSSSSLMPCGIDYD
jgi:hypothetical protein